MKLFRFLYSMPVGLLVLLNLLAVIALVTLILAIAGQATAAWLVGYGATGVVVGGGLIYVTFLRRRGSQ